MAYATTEQTFIKRPVNTNLHDVPELEILLPPGAKVASFAPPSTKDSAYNTDDYKTRTLDGSAEKDTIYFNNEVADMIRTLQMQVESLRERVDVCKKSDGDAVYETIDSRRLKKSHNPRKRPPSVDNNNGSNDSWKKYMRDRGFHRLGYVIDPDIGALRSWRSHLSSRGFHGLKYVLDPAMSTLKRCFLIFLFFCCLGLFVYHLRERVLLYLSHPTSTDIDVDYLHSVDFPDVTICNLNKFRLTKTVELGLFRDIHYSLHDDPAFPYDTARRFRGHPADVRYTEFLNNVSHKKNDFIHSCTLNNVDCGLDVFNIVHTDLGMCFTFNPKTIRRKTSKADSTLGLSLVLNVEQYEYLLGPRSAVGVRVSVHEPGRVPTLSQDGVNAAVGTHTSIGLKKMKQTPIPFIDVPDRRPRLSTRPSPDIKLNETLRPVSTESIHERKGLYKLLNKLLPGEEETRIMKYDAEHVNLPPPHGTCSKPGWSIYRREMCLKECEIKQVRNACQCTMTSYPEDVKPCTIRDYFTCVMTELDGYTVETPHNVSYQCHECPQECDKTSYAMDVSNAATSVYAAESFVRTLPEVDVLQQRFQKARDIYHRVDDIIYSYDNDTLMTISEGFMESISNISDFFRQMTIYEKEYVTKLNKLHDAVRTLNETIRRKYDQFKQTSHITFYSLDNTLKSTMMDIVDRAQTRDFQFINAEQINITLLDLTKKIETLVVSKDHGSWVKKSILLEMTEGVEKFRDDLLLGYGQMYREFKEEREFYDNLTQSIMRIVRLLTEKLVQNLAKVRELLRLSNLKDPKVVDTLDEISREINNAVEVTVSELVTNLDELSEKYRSQKDQILNLVDKLVEIGGYFSTTVETIQDLLSSLQTLVQSLKGEIQALAKEITVLRYGYADNQFGKSELARRFNKDNLNSLIEATKNYLSDVVLKVEEIRERGVFVARSVNPLEHRISDFDLMERKDVSSLVLWLKFPTIKSESELLRSTLERTISRITEYCEELEEYTKNNRIDGDFYQNNFLQLEIFFQEISVTKVMQQISYGLFALACDVGGLSALFIGASILTLFEAVDMLFGLACMPKEKQKREKAVRADYTDVMAVDKGPPGRACAEAAA